MWSNCLHRLEQELSDQQLNTWIRPLQVIEENNEIKLLAPNRFVQDWVKQNFHEKIQSILFDLDAEQSIQLNIEIGSQNKSPMKDPEPAEPIKTEAFFSSNKPKENRSFVEHNLNLTSSPKQHRSRLQKTLEVHITHCFSTAALV